MKKIVEFHAELVVIDISICVAGSVEPGQLESILEVERDRGKVAALSFQY